MLFSVKDLKAGIYQAPFIAESDDEARRMIDVLFRTPEKSLITMYPDDFILYRIGDFDKYSGVLVDDEHVSVCRISELSSNPFRKIDVPDFSNKELEEVSV